MNYRVRQLTVVFLICFASTGVNQAVLGADTNPSATCTNVPGKSGLAGAPRPQPEISRERPGVNCLIDAAALLPNGSKIVDIRGRAEYAKLHIPGSINQPLQSLRNPGSAPLVVYDDGRLRSDALQLCERLSRYGVQNFKVIDGGIAAWAQSTRSSSVLDVSRLSDMEASAALVAGGSTVIPLSSGFSEILRNGNLGASASGNNRSGRTIVLAEASSDRHLITEKLTRRAGQNTTLYWTGTPDRLASLIGTHLAQEQRRQQGPMVSSTCPGF